MRSEVLIVMLGILGAGAAPAGGQCVNYEDVMHVESMLDLGGPARSVAIVEDVALVAGGDAGLAVVDLSGTDPVLAQTLPTPLLAEDVDVQGQFAYLVQYDNGWPPEPSLLWILDVSAPAAPVLIGELELPGFAYEIIVEDDLAYIATGWEGGYPSFRIVDVSDPQHPTALGSGGSGGPDAGVVGFAVQGGFVHFAVNGLIGSYYDIYDATDPADPQLVANVDIAQDYGGIALAGPLAYVSTFDGLVALDISDPASPQVLATAPALGGHPLFAGGYLFLVGDGIQVADVSDPLAMTLLGEMDLPSSPQEMAVVGGSAFVACQNAGLVDVYLGGFETASPLSVLDVGTGSDVAVDGALAAVASFQSLVTVDVSDLGQPVELGSLYLGEYLQAVAIDGSRVYGAAEDLGLAVFDIATPTAPSLVTTLPLPGPAVDMAFSAPYAFVCTYYSGLCAVDLSSPESPLLLDTLPLPGATVYCTLVGSLAYVINHGWLTIVDVSDPAQLTVLSQTALPYDYESVTVASDLAYVCAYGIYDAGLRVYDVSTPGAPELLAENPDLGMTRLMVDGPVGYGATGQGLVVLQLVPPTHPQRLGGADALLLRNLQVTGDAVFCAEVEGLRIQPLQCAPTSVPPSASDVIALDAWPNPFNPKVTLRFTLPAAGRATLLINDVSGRRVATLAEGVYGAGEQRWTWDGRDSRGRAVASGVYFATLNTASGNGNRKLVMLR
ncbi:MAG: FlgD immunoglobulin-like domain containing protein [Candidatus Krumholzibacteriia bacterium]